MFSLHSQCNATCHAYHNALLRQGLLITTKQYNRVRRNNNHLNIKKEDQMKTHTWIEMSDEGTGRTWLSKSCIKLSAQLGRTRITRVNFDEGEEDNARKLSNRLRIT